MGLITSDRFRDYEASRWLSFTPPRDFSSTFYLGMREAWQHAPTSLMIENWNRQDDIEEIKQRDERNKQIISPDQAIKEYPNSAKIIKKPVTRAEAMYWSREQEERDALAQAFAGKYDGYMPQWSVLVGSGFTSIVDPVYLGLGILSYGATLSVPSARQWITISNLVDSAAKSRSASAAFMALDGAIGGVLSGLVSKPLHSMSERNYGLWDFTAETAMGAGIGGALGFAFRGLTSAQKPLLATRGAADYLATLMRIKKEIVQRRSDDFWRIMQSNSGAIDLTGMVSSFQGRSGLDRMDYLSRMGTDYKRAVKEAEIVYNDAGGMKRRASAQDFSKFSAQVRQGYVKTSDRFTSLRVGPEGIKAWNKRPYGRIRKFYETDMISPVKPKEGELKQGNLVFSEMYIPYTKGEIGGTQSGTQFFGANTSELAAAISQINNQNKKIDIGKVKFNKDEPAFLFNLDDFDFKTFGSEVRRMRLPQRKFFNESIVARIARAGSWKNMPVQLKNLIMKHMPEHPSYDGVGYRYGKQGILENPTYAIELSKSGVTKAENFSSHFVEYDVKEPTPDTNALYDILTGKHPHSVAPVVKDLMEEFYVSRAIEGTNYFDTFVRRQSPYAENIYRDGSAPMEIKLKTKAGELSFTDSDVFIDTAKWEVGQVPHSGVLYPGGATLKRILKEINETLTSEGVNEKPISRIGGVRSVRGAMTITPDVGMPLLYEALKKEGFTFPESVPYNARADRPFFTQNRLISAWDQEGNFLQRMMNDPELPDDLQVELPSRTLDLTLHPSVMTPEELHFSSALVDEGKIPEVDDINRVTTWGDITSEIYSRNNSFARIGVGDIKYRNKSGDVTFSTGGTSTTLGVGSYKSTSESLAKKRQKVTPEGQTEVIPERSAEFKTLFKNYQNDTRHGYYASLIKNIRQSVSGDQIIEDLDKMGSEYRNLYRKARGMKAGEQDHIRTEGKIRQMEASFRQMSAMVDTVAQANISDPTTRLGKWFNKFGHGHAEILGTIATTVDMPYRTLGGDNIDITRRTQMRKYHTALLRGLEEIGGTELVSMVQSGIYDEELLKIKHFKIKKRKESKGLSGKLQEQTEELEVSPIAWKVYKHLENTMQGLQKELLDSGYFREPRFDYIGTRFYDLRVIANTSAEEFAKDVVKFTELKHKDAVDLYVDLRESHKVQYIEREKDMGDVSDKFNHSQRIDFKDAKSEIEFMKKYGSLKTSFPGSPLSQFVSRSDPRGGSSVFTGALLSVQRDATLMAINSWMGSRPLLTLDLMFATLAKKSKAGLAEGLEVSRIQDLNFRRSQKHAENMIDSLLFPMRASFSQASEVRKFLHSAQNIAKLGTSVFKVLFLDVASSVATMARMKSPGNAIRPLSLLSSTFEVLGNRLKFISPTKRREVARRMGVLLSSDTRQFAGRFEGEPVGWYSWLESLAMRSYGIPAATDIGKISNATMIGHWFSESFKLPWGSLTDHVQDRLRTFGMTEEVWDTVRVLPGTRDNVDGVEMVMMDNLYNAIQEHGNRNKLTDKQINSMFRSFDTFSFHKAEEQGIPVQGIYEASLFDINRNDPDSIIHNLGKLAVQYKAIGAAVGRSVVGSMADIKPGGRVELRAQSVGALAAYLTVMGAVAREITNVAKGRTVTDLDHMGPDYWFDAFATGGAMGLFGDFLFSDFADDQRGVTSWLLGPTLGGTVPNAKAAVSHMLTGEWDEAWGDAGRTASDFFPKITAAQDFALNVFFLRPFGALSGSGASMERKRMEEYGYDYLVN